MGSFWLLWFRSLSISCIAALSKSCAAIPFPAVRDIMNWNFHSWKFSLARKDQDPLAHQPLQRSVGMWRSRALGLVGRELEKSFEVGARSESSMPAPRLPGTPESPSPAQLCLFTSSFREQRGTDLMSATQQPRSATMVP